jgi:peptidoglycan/xylan/chitin deacetylase (PgdA/CDA1 family)
MNNARWRPTLLIRATLLLHALALIVVIADPLQWRRVLFAVLANHALLMLTGLWPRSHWLGPNWTRLPLAAADRHEIALTIDDGPDPVVTPQVLDMLDRYHVRATFFCIGEKAAHYPDLCREIVLRGHTIENHSQHHRHHFSIMGRATMMHELQTAQQTLTAITGKPPLFFRAPAGLRNPFLDPVLTKLDLRLASWSARGFDTRVNDAARVTNRLLRNLRAGAILLLHDGNAARTPGGIPVILDVLPTLLTAARAADLRFVTLRAALL